MALNIKNPVVERLAEEVAKMSGETKTEAIRRALQERKDRLAVHIPHKDPRSRVMQFLERDVWPAIPRQLLGRKMARKQHDDILGYGSRGV